MGFRLSSTLSALKLAFLFFIAPLTLSLAFRPNSLEQRYSLGARHHQTSALPRQWNSLANPKISRSHVAHPTSSSSSSTTQLQVWGHALAAIDGFYHTAPYAAAALTCCFKASAADYVAQTRQQEKFQVARNVAFLLYGAIYQGIAQEYLYNHCYATWFGDSNAPAVVAKKVLFDLLVQTPLVTLPMAYLTKAVIFRHSLGEALSRYKSDVVNNGLLTKYFKLWGPVQCLTFGVIPEHLRISFIASVSFFWLVIFSTISGQAPISKVKPSRLVAASLNGERNEDLPLDKDLVSPSLFVATNGTAALATSTSK